MLEGTDIGVLENLAAEKLGTLEVEIATSASGKVCLIVTENPFEDSHYYYLGNEGADCYEVRHNGEKPSTFDDLKTAICEVAEAREREEEEAEPTAREILTADRNTPAEVNRRLKDGTFTIYHAEDLTTPGEGELEEIADCMRAGNFSEEEIADYCAVIAQCARGEGHPSGDWGACTCKGRRYLIEYEN